MNNPMLSVIFSSLFLALGPCNTLTVLIMQREQPEAMSQLLDYIINDDSMPPETREHVEEHIREAGEAATKLRGLLDKIRPSNEPIPEGFEAQAVSSVIQHLGLA